MLAELRQKSQITIPKELVDKLGLSEGDKLEIYEKEGIICIVPFPISRTINSTKKPINSQNPTQRFYHPQSPLSTSSQKHLEQANQCRSVAVHGYRMSLCS